jgi:uncharacterized protein DUF4191
MAKSPTPAEPDKLSRRQQFAQTYQMAKRSDPRLGLWVAGAGLLAAIVGFGLFFLVTGSGGMLSIALSVVGGVMLGILAALIIFSRRAQKAVYGQMEGQVGPPGIVLVGEGNPGRVKSLLTGERRRHERVATDAPVHEIIVGSEEGQIPLSKLSRHVQKMKRQVKPAEITDILARLKAIDASRPPVPMPKGPVPTSMKGLRGNMRGR